MELMNYTKLSKITINTYLNQAVKKKKIARGKADLIYILQNLFIKNFYEAINEDELEELGKK